MNPSGLDYTSPAKFTFKQKAVLFALPPLISGVFKVIGHSCRVECRNEAHFRKTLEGRGRVILAVWHECLGVAAYYYRNSGYHTLTSYSFDGELAARVVQRFGMRAVRGSSSRGGFRALGQLEKALEQAPVAGFTLDGPKGPRRVAKPGIAILSARTGVPIVPNAFRVTPCWRMSSWDRLIIPRPFATLVCAYGPPIPPPADCSGEAIEATRLQVEEALNRLHSEIEGQEPTP